MRRLARRALGACSVVSLAAGARADAPPNGTDPQYGLFDGTTVVITDQHTGLHWQRTLPAQQSLTFAQAADYCASLSLVYPTPWRVPSYKELLTIVDEAPHPEYEAPIVVWKAIDPDAFPHTAVGEGYWSSSIAPFSSTPQNSAQAYMVNFNTGQALAFPQFSSGAVRCVHD